MTAWILPSIKLEGVVTPVGTAREAFSKDRGLVESNKNDSSAIDPDEPYIYRLIQFWQQFYDACERRTPLTSRPTKRQRNTYHYPLSSSSPRSSIPSFDDPLEGSYNLPAAIALTSIMLECAATVNETGWPTNEDEDLDRPKFTWQTLHHQAHGLAKTFKTLTVEDIQAALTVLGMQCLKEGRQIPGLTPRLIFDDYLSRTGYETRIQHALNIFIFENVLSPLLFAII